MLNENVAPLPDPEQAREARLITAEKLSAIANDLEAIPDVLSRFATVLDLASHDTLVGTERPAHAARCAAFASDLQRIVSGLRELALDLLPKRNSNGGGHAGGNHAA
jgi:hypothetical protein